MSDAPKKGVRAIMPPTLAPVYLGDGVYGAHRGDGIWLRVDNGGGDVNRIFLEPEVLKRIVAECDAAPEAWAAIRAATNAANGEDGGDE